MTSLTVDYIGGALWFTSAKDYTIIPCGDLTRAQIRNALMLARARVMTDEIEATQGKHSTTAKMARAIIEMRLPGATIVPTTCGPEMGDWSITVTAKARRPRKRKRVR